MSLHVTGIPLDALRISLRDDCYRRRFDVVDVLTL